MVSASLDVKGNASHARSSCVLPTQLHARSIVELALIRTPEQLTRTSEHPKLLEAPSRASMQNRRAFEASDSR